MSKPVTDTNEVKIAVMYTVTPGAGTLHPGGTSKLLVARKPDAKVGCDIAWIRVRRAFRVEWNEPGKDVETRWVMETDVSTYTEAV